MHQLWCKDRHWTTTLKCRTRLPTPRQAPTCSQEGCLGTSTENPVDVLISKVSFNEHVLLKQNKRKDKGSAGKPHIPHSE